MRGRAFMKGGRYRMSGNGESRTPPGFLQGAHVENVFINQGGTERAAEISQRALRDFYGPTTTMDEGPIPWLRAQVDEITALAGAA